MITLRQILSPIFSPMLSLLLSLFVLAACGQKGPLYLPGNPDEIQTEVPVQDGETADDDEDDPQP